MACNLYPLQSLNFHIAILDFLVDEDDLGVANKKNIVIIKQFNGIFVLNPLGLGIQVILHRWQDDASMHRAG